MGHAGAGCPTGVAWGRWSGGGFVRWGGLRTRRHRLRLGAGRLAGPHARHHLSVGSFGVCLQTKRAAMRMARHTTAQTPDKAARPPSS